MLSVYKHDDFKFNKSNKTIFYIQQQLKDWYMKIVFEETTKLAKL